MLTPDEVRDTSFSAPPIGKRGYDMAEVDAFLDRIEATLRGTDSLTADEVRAVLFGKPPIGRRGYNEDEVDAFLDTVEAHLSGRPVQPPATTPLPRPTDPPADPPPGMVAPKRRWWRR